MRIRSLLPALSVCLAACLGCALFYPRGDTAALRDMSSAELASLRDELDGMRAELARMRSDTALLRARLDALQPDDEKPPQPLVKREPDTNGDEPDDEPSTARDADAVYEAEWSRVVGRYANEKPDPGWNPAPELGRKLTAALPTGSSLRELTCRASLCRVETSHRGLSSYQTFAELFELRAEGPQVWSGAASFRVTREPQGPGDTLEAVAYLHRLP